MDVLKMIAELQQERGQIEETIIAIERLASGQGKRRGRPPTWMKEAAGQQEQAEGGAGDGS